MCEVFLTNINLPTNNKKWRAGHLKFLVRLVKLVKRPGVCFGVASKMRNFIRRKFVSMSPLVRGWMVLYTLYFPAHRHFQLFCSRWPSYLRNYQYNVPTGTRRSAVKKNETGRIFGQQGTPSRKWIFAEISASFWQLTIGMLCHRSVGHFWGSWATGNKKNSKMSVSRKNTRCRVSFSL